MGVDLATERAGFAKMEDVNFTDSELVYHVRDALRSVTLAASSGKYVDSCLDMLVSNFMPPHSFLELRKQPRGLARKGKVLYRLHSALKGISDLVPLAPLRLLPIVIQKMLNVCSKEPLVLDTQMWI